MQFSVLLETDKFYLSLQDVDHGKTSKVEIFYQEPEDNNIHPPPSALLKYLAEFDQQQKERILKIRRKIIRFDCRIQEVYSAGSVKYGNGTTKSSKSCAEFLLDKKYGLTLFLWIPYKGGKSKRIGRARIWTDWYEKALIEGYVSTGIGTEINRHKRNVKSLIQALEPELQRKSWIGYYGFRHYENGKEYHYNLMTTKNRAEQYLKEAKNVFRLVREDDLLTYEDTEFISFYKQLIQKKTDICPDLQPNYKSLNSLLDLALEKWLHRL